MNKQEKTEILNQSPIQYAKLGLAYFMTPKRTLTINMGGGESHDIIRNEPEGYSLLRYRSAQDKREPTQDELKLRVELTYLNEYADVLKQYMKELKKQAFDLKPEYTVENLNR